MYKDAKRAVHAQSYASISELIRAALRKQLYPELTINGFTPEFEEEVLRSAAEPEENDLVWETEKDITEYFNKLKKEARPHAKS